MKSVIQEMITSLEEVQKNIHEKSEQEVRVPLYEAYYLFVSFFGDEIQTYLLLDHLIEICQKDPAMKNIQEEFQKIREEMNQNRSEIYDGSDLNMWEELNDLENTDYYEQKSVLELTKIAANFWKNNQDHHAKEYYLRAKRLVSQGNLEEIMVFFDPYNFLEYIYVQERDYSSLKKYYLWSLEQLLKVQHTSCVEYIVSIYFKLACLAMYSSNIEEMNHYFQKILQFIIEKHNDTEDFMGDFEVGRLLDSNWMKEVVLYDFILSGQNSEECFNQMISLSDLYISKYESGWLLEEILNWLKRTKDTSKLQEVIDAFVQKNAEFHSNFETRILQTAVEICDADSLELADLCYDYAKKEIVQSYYNGYAYMSGYNSITSYAPMIKEALRVYEIYYPAGSSELYEKYIETIYLYLNVNRNDLFLEIVKSYRDKLLEIYPGGYSTEVEEFCEDMSELIGRNIDFGPRKWYEKIDETN